MRNRVGEEVVSKSEVMREELQNRGLKADVVERRSGPYPHGEAVVAVGKEDGLESELSNQVYVTIAFESKDAFREEVQQSLDETDVEFWPADNADEVFEPIEGAGTDTADNEDTKSITEW